MSRKIYLINVIAILVSAILFYFIQNNHLSQSGGEVAFVKSLWLGMCIFYWFVLPVVIVCSKDIGKKTILLYKLFLFNMLIRAVIELFMMYVTQNWHPYLGIGHNIFSLILVFSLLKSVKLDSTKKVLVINFMVMGFMFIPESIFAYYMLTKVTNTTGPVYFVPDSSEHLLVMIATWAVVMALALWQTIFARRWFYAKA